jgi:hypothetical protein
MRPEGGPTDTLMVTELRGSMSSEQMRCRASAASGAAELYFSGALPGGEGYGVGWEAFG